MNATETLPEIEQAPITDALALKNAERKEKENNDPKMQEIYIAKNNKKLALYPDPALKQVCKDVVNFNSYIKDITTEMLQMMKQLGGIGLAAPQIGITENFFVCNTTGKPEDDMVFINPKLELSGKMINGVEKCLSLPGVAVECKRYPKAKITYKDINGNEMVQEVDGRLAIVCQHESDHLLGRTIEMRMNLTDKVINKRQLDRLKKIAQMEKEKQEKQEELKESEKKAENQEIKIITKNIT